MRGTTLVAIAFCLSAAPFARGEDVTAERAREARLAEAWNEVTSMRGRIAIHQHAPEPGTAGFRASGTAEYLKRDGVLFARQLLRYTSEAGGEPYGISNVFDGEFVWVQRPGPDGVEVYKFTHAPAPADFMSYIDWTTQFERLREMAALVWREDEMVNGAAAHVLDVILDESDPISEVRTTRSYFSALTGIPVKAIGFDGEGRIQYEWTFEVAGVNDLSGDLTFEYIVPANGTVHDMTEPEE